MRPASAPNATATNSRSTPPTSRPSTPSTPTTTSPTTTAYATTAPPHDTSHDGGPHDRPRATPRVPAPARHPPHQGSHHQPGARSRRTRAGQAHPPPASRHLDPVRPRHRPHRRRPLARLQRTRESTRRLDRRPGRTTSSMTAYDPSDDYAERQA